VRDGVVLNAMRDEPVVLAVVGAPHGVRGEVRVKTFTADPLAVGDYGPLFLPDGRKLKAKSVRPGTEIVIIKFEGINDRNAAEALKHLTLSVPRSRLPADEDEDEFYHADLIGLPCETAEGKLLGHVASIHDFGAGDVLDIRTASGPGLSLAFTKENVPVVDMAAGKLIVVLPIYVEAKEGSEKGKGA
jgi:16S rRNA processing protein RimM